VGELITIMARDGHEFQAWISAPAGRPRGALVVIQEVFGVNGHIRGLTDGFAAEGYTAIAPSLFDRVRRGIELGYSDGDMQEGVGYRKQISNEIALKDIAAAAAAVRHSGRSGIVGYCWGGTLAYLAACELALAAAVVYYGRVVDYLDRKPRCPVMYHYGTEDRSIPLADVERTRAAAAPRSVVHVYPGAGHGFNCEQRGAHNPEVAGLARRRTLEFFARYLAGSEPAAE
jgi:carboxymethylenebutenolidase